MAISGLIAGGVDQALEQVLERRLQEAIRLQREQEHADQVSIQRDTLAGLTADRTADNDRQRRVIDLAELKRVDDLGREQTQKNAASDMAGVLAMPGMSNEAKASEIMGSGLRTGQVDPARVIEGLTRVQPPPARDPIADHEAKARIDAKYRRPESGSARQQSQWVRMPDGSVVDINGVAPPGSKPYDAVAERSSQPANPAEAQDTAREASRLAQALLKHEGLGGAFGVVDAALPTMRQSTADAESLRDSLTSLLTLENTGKLKGVLSNTDMQILRQASSSLNAKMGDKAAKAELARIVEVMNKAAGGASGGPSPMTPASSHGPSAPSSRVDDLIKKYGGGGA
jgi:hypothetical protein